MMTTTSVLPSSEHWKASSSPAVTYTISPSINMNMMDSENVINQDEPQLEQADTVSNSSRHSTTNNPSTGSAKLVNWRGNLVPESEGKALRHVFDHLQDHFGHQRPDPNVTFSTSLVHSSSEDGHSDNPNNNYWRGDIDFTYNINGERCNLAYIGMDVCIDLTPKRIHKFGRPIMTEYGSSWVYAYVPDLTMEKIKTYVKVGTGWDVSDEGTVHDPNRNLVAIEAKLNNEMDQPKPSFWVVKEQQEYGVGDISFSRIGSIQEVHEDQSQKHVHRGVGIFSVEMEVEGTRNFKPNPRDGDEANLIFTLVSVRTWGVTDCIAPIVHAPTKMMK